MNELNYATQPACQRLKDAGIVLETDAVWYKYDWGINGDRWAIYDADELTSTQQSNSIPAPTLAEVWRELPVTITTEDNTEAWLCVEKVMQDDDSQATIFRYEYYSAYFHTLSDEISFLDTNPTDAAIDLLIWLKEKGLHK